MTRHWRFLFCGLSGGGLLCHAHVAVGVIILQQVAEPATSQGAAAPLLAPLFGLLLTACSVSQYVARRRVVSSFLLQQQQQRKASQLVPSRSSKQRPGKRD